jgi:hypothetical protein
MGPLKPNLAHPEIAVPQPAAANRKKCKFKQDKLSEERESSHLNNHDGKK